MILHVARLWGFAVLCSLLLMGNDAPRAQSAAEHGSAASKTGAITTRPASPQPSFQPAPAAAANRSPYLPARSGPAPELTNRRALEKKAGKEAAKLLIRSEPPAAHTWVNDLYVGTTPVLLILPPGSFQLKLRTASEFSEQRVSLLAREQQTVLVVLPNRYPTSVRLR